MQSEDKKKYQEKNKKMRREKVVKNRGEKKERSVGTSVTQGFRTNQPSIKNDGRRCVVVHREMLSEVLGSVGFQVQHNLALNPGLPLSFPWLSKMAANWEQYVFRRLSFHYIARCSTLTAGAVMMAPDYDVNDRAPLDKKQLLAYQNASENSSWTKQSCFLSRSSMFPFGGRKYIRDTLVAKSQNTYDAGRFLLCVQGQADNSAIGDLWVEYEVEFSVPQIDIGPPSANFAAYHHSSSQSITIGSSNVPINFEQTNVNSYGIIRESNNSFILPKGNFWIVVSVYLDGAGGYDMSSTLQLFYHGTLHANTRVSLRTQMDDYGHEHPLTTQTYVESNGTTLFQSVVTVLGTVLDATVRGGRLSFLLV